MSQHNLTIADLTEGPSGDTYYTGPLEVAQDFIRKEASVAELEETPGVFTVLLCADEKPATWETANEWGKGRTLDEAWRYALGAAFGPADDEFEPFMIEVD